MKLTQRIISLALAAIVSGLTMGWATTASAAYPDRQVRFIVPFPPAGATDTLARILADKLTQLSGQSFIVENRAGAGGNIGLDTMIRQPADGYTIAMITTAHAINMSMPQKANYDLTKDVTPVSYLASSSNVLIVNKNLPVHNVDELIALGRSGKMVLNFGSAGNGTSTHLAGELFKQITHVKMTHIPYRGAGPAMIDLIGGNVQLMFAAISSAEEQIKHGDVRALAISSAQRSKELSNVPTFVELGMPNYIVEGWLGLVAPAGLNPEALKWLDENIRKAMTSPDVIQSVQKLGLRVTDEGSAQFGTFVASEVAKWGGVLKNIDMTSN